MELSLVPVVEAVSSPTPTAATGCTSRRSALEAVLEEVEREQPDVIVFGGDLVSGPLPRETQSTRYTGWGSRVSLGSAPSSWMREVIASLVNTLCRWYSTVRELMKSCAPISGFE
jgi:hypothetical protein